MTMNVHTCTGDRLIDRGSALHGMLRRGITATRCNVIRLSLGMLIPLARIRSGRKIEGTLRTDGGRSALTADRDSNRTSSLAWKSLLLLTFASLALMAQLPPEIEADRYMMRAESAINDQDYAQARAAMEKVLELQSEHGLEIPEAFHFRNAEVALQIGDHAGAIESVTRYLTVAGQDGEHYREALRLLNAAETAQSSPIAGMEFVRVPAG